ncbi:MAG: haloacid dehalogenase-like hydrolase [Thermoplasmata archaeon]|nr:haloacid dehalogenase-like hydrolase [Thermoplasmata archaeon]
MADFRWRLVTFDIDGTLTRGHGWRTIAVHTGRLPAFEATDARYRRREVGEDAHLRALLNLAKGHTTAEIAQILEATPKVAHIADAVRALRRRGSRVALLSHNPDYVCDWYRRRFGFDDAEGTPGTRLRGPTILPYGRVHADKGAGLARLLARAGVAPTEAVHVGDGRADARIFPRLGGGIALNSRLPEVRAAADAVLETDDLRKIVPVLARLVPHRSPI